MTLLGVRERVAERIAALPSAKALETPVLDELPVPAYVIAEYGAPALPTMPSVPGAPQTFAGIPGFAWGKVRGDVAGKWYKVTFPHPIRDASVVCTAVGRTGTIKQRAIAHVAPIEVAPLPSVPTIPHPTVPTIQLPQLKEIPIPEPDISTITNQIRKKWDEIVTDVWQVNYYINFGTIGGYKIAKTFTFGFNWLRNKLRTILCTFLARIVKYVVWSLVVRPQVVKITETMNDNIHTHNNAVQHALNVFNDNSRRVFNQLNDQFNTQLNNLVAQINDKVSAINARNAQMINNVTDRVNRVLKDLYAMWGIPENMALTPVHVRNVTSTGFEFQSLGNTEVYYIALGKHTR